MMDFSDGFLGYLELKQDLLFHKIPDEKVPYYVREALEIGRKLGQEFKGKSPEELLADRNIAVKTDEGDGSFFKVTFRAQFEADRKGNHQVLIYDQSIRALAEANQLEMEAMKNIVLMHEFFHYLEYGHGLMVPDQLENIESFQFLGLSRKAKVQRTSEIAANSFTKEALDLPFLPSCYDYIYLLKTGGITESELVSEQQQYKKLFEKVEKSN
ncbi:hypothetical protein ACYSNR_14080 [Enterococcus sp. LJL128]|uniref:hypothetical protein n=1 Tax=Enterococcus sp. LJL51 TaxID=3416656 RepID=UPI003CF4C935